MRTTTNVCDRSDPACIDRKRRRSSLAGVSLTGRFGVGMSTRACGRGPSNVRGFHKRQLGPDRFHASRPMLFNVPARHRKCLIVDKFKRRFSLRASALRRSASVANL
jgi:hypothetical protein